MPPAPLPPVSRLLRSAAGLIRHVPASIAALPGRRRALNDRGQALDPHLSLMIWSGELTGAVMKKTSVLEARESGRQRFALIAGDPAPVERVTDGALSEGTRVRVYEPHPGAPTFVFLHGGGWVVSDLDTHDNLCRRLAAEGGWRVVSVDYPLAPEHPHPEPQRGALRAFREIRAGVAAAGGDPAQVAVGGDSAGGHLSAVLCHMLRELGEPQPSLQVLLYPALDLTRSTASFRALGEGYLLTAEDIDWFLAHYAAPDPFDPAVSPLRAADLSGLAPAVVATAGFDPLRDEGEAYARRLKEAGVPVVHLDEPSMVHGYAQMDGVVPGADAALRRVIAAVKR